MTKIITQLQNGNERFLQQKTKQHSCKVPNGMASGQKPFAAILTCADSRVIPEKSFDCAFGELFVIRVAGNTANASSIASLEYAVHALGVEQIVVLGHQNCGAVSAACSREESMSPALDHLLDHIEPALKPDADVNTNVENNIQFQCGQLLEKSDILRKAVDNQKLTISGAFYSLENAGVRFMG